MAINEEAEASAIAAFTLAKMTFWHLLQQGVIDKSEAELWLGRAITAYGKGGAADQNAAAKLEELLRSVQVYQPPPRR